MIAEQTFKDFIVDKGLEEEFYNFIPKADRKDFKELFGVDTNE